MHSIDSQLSALVFQSVIMTKGNDNTSFNYFFANKNVEKGGTRLFF